ncbi:MAG: sigma-54 dependent transcriptional regulator [Pseudomonadota bacterium]
MDARILLVDDDAQQRRYICAVLAASGYSASSVDCGQAALDRLRSDGAEPCDLILLDLQMPDMDGIEVLKHLRAGNIQTPVLVMTADGSVSRAVDAMRAGANDFLIKPVGPERLDVSIRNALAMSDLSTEVRRLSRAEENRLSFEELVAVASSTRDAISMARRSARSDIPILIEGESGTGKEIFARAIHGSSERAGSPFVAVNCGALPAQLVESILFGHEKGAFTGATEKRIGRFQEASGGTLFLDEVGELPLDAQVKLLRAIQTGEVDPVGATQPVKVDIRLISATNRDLSEMIQMGGFREDLYYRLSVFPLKLPPLRERREDLPGLARMFLKRFAAAEAVPVEGFTQSAMEAIAHAEWPGNVRQLENTIHRAVVMADSPLIRPSDLHGIEPRADMNATRMRVTDHLMSGDAGMMKDHDSHSLMQDPLIREDGHIRRLLEIEADAIAKALTIYRGRMSETARRLGIGRSTLYRKIDELQIDKRDI